MWHCLTDTLFIVMSGMICGYEEWDLIHQWAKAKVTQKWLRRYIGLSNGIPSLSTKKRCMGLIELEAFEARFIAWMKAMHALELGCREGEDRNQTHEATAVRNLATVRRKVFNTLQQETRIHPKLSKAKKRVVAATDPKYRDVLIDLNFKDR
ncbi:transposase family protein [Paenibacillus sp. FSL P2-0136]|uniref:transposase family protein n=1 Tax=Paenibacillus sp. FSL P2-0136 TaxID=2975317 RepID=UPI0030D9789D